MTGKPPPPLRPDSCKHCEQPIVWGRLQNGRNRSFDQRPARAADVAPADRYAYNRRYRAVVCLDGEPRSPELVLQAHRCREYVEARDEARLMRGVEGLGDAIERVMRRS